MSQKIEEHFSQSMNNIAGALLNSLHHQYPQFSSNLGLQKKHLDRLQVNFQKNVDIMKKDMLRSGEKVLLDRHKLSSCAVKTIMETKVFQFKKKGIENKAFPAVLAFANEYFAYILVPTIVDAFRVEVAQSTEIVPYVFPIVYGGVAENFDGDNIDNVHFFDYVFCKLLYPYRSSRLSSKFPTFEFAILLCALNTAWNCYHSEKACAFYYEFGRKSA
jgi:hypothetical protein